MFHKGPGFFLLVRVRTPLFFILHLPTSSGPVDVVHEFTGMSEQCILVTSAAVFATKVL